MARLRLSLALTRNARTRPLLEGRIGADGIELVTTPLAPSEMFWRQLKFAEFDASEMSIASLTIATAHAPTAWIALPVFTTRVFFHTDIIVRAGAGIRAPQDLRGKRIGVPEYQQTRAVWVRGALQHAFGVAPHDLRWFMERTVERSHGGATAFVPPPGIDLTYVPPERDLGAMLLAGDLDAAVHHFSERNLVDRALVDLRGRAEVVRLFPDPAAEARRYYAATAIYPINHCLVVRRRIVERHPWVARSLYDALLAAKAAGAARAEQLLGPARETGLLDAGALACDPMPYGIEASRAVLETLMGYLVEQGLTPRRVALDEVFFPEAFAW